MSFSVVEIIMITQIKARAVYYNVKNPILIILLLPFQFSSLAGPKAGYFAIVFPMPSVHWVEVSLK